MAVGSYPSFLLQCDLRWWSEHQQQEAPGGRYETTISMYYVKLRPGLQVGFLSVSCFHNRPWFRENCLCEDTSSIERLQLSREGGSEHNPCTQKCTHSKILSCALCFPHNGISSGEKNTTTIKTFLGRAEKQLQNGREFSLLEVLTYHWKGLVLARGWVNLLP